MEGGNAVLAFDIGGTDMKAGIVLPSTRIVGLQRLATPHDADSPGQAVVDRITELADEYKHRYPQHPFAAVGLVVPGLVDEATGTGVHSANLGWHQYPFVTRAEALIGAPIAFGHDVGAAGEAEFRMGAAKDAENAVVMVIGTGIAGAVFCDGRRVTAGGYAGELGHAHVPDPDQPGATTILEGVASAAAIAVRYAKATGRTVPGAREVLDFAASGDQKAVRVWAEAVDALAFSITQCVSILGTDTIVIGGGLSQAGEALLEPLRLCVEAQLTFHRRPEIRTAQLGQNAGLIGAALKARDLLHADDPGGVPL